MKKGSGILKTAMTNIKFEEQELKKKRKTDPRGHVSPQSNRPTYAHAYAMWESEEKRETLACRLGL